MVGNVGNNGNLWTLLVYAAKSGTQMDMGYDVAHVTSLRIELR